MEIVKLLKDYSKTPLEQKLNEYLSNSLDSTICREPIKNKEFLIHYIKPVNNFTIYTTAMPYSDCNRLFT